MTVDPIVGHLPLPREDVIVFHYCFLNLIHGQQSLRTTLLGIRLNLMDLGPMGPVIVLTFGNVLERTYIFQTFLTFILHPRLVTTPNVHYAHMIYVYSFSYVSHSRSHGQEKSSLYYDLFDFGVLLYRRTPTLILFYSLYNPTTPILPVYVDQRRSHLKKDTPRMSRMVERKIP